MELRSPNERKQRVDKYKYSVLELGGIYSRILAKQKSQNRDA